MVTKHHHSSKFYDAFHALDSNAHLVVGVRYESKKFYDAFDPNAHLMLAERQESNKFHGAFNA